MMNLKVFGRKRHSLIEVLSRKLPEGIKENHRKPWWLQVAAE
jgi:hypothetical protein